MSLSSERMMQLMAYADGELEGDERLEVERLIATDIDASRFVNDIAGLGALVETGHQASKTAEAVASFDVASSIMAAVAREVPTKSAPPVTSLDAARGKRAKRYGTFGAVAAALALAASFFIATRSQKEAPMAPVAVAPPAAPASAEPGVDVETPGESVRVFYLSSETSPTTSVVVWVDESGGNGR